MASRTTPRVRRAQFTSYEYSSPHGISHMRVFFFVGFVSLNCLSQSWIVMPSKVTVDIIGLSGGFVTIGGWATLQTFYGPELFRGTLRGTSIGEVPITPLHWTGVGIAGKRITATVDVECNPGEAEFGPGDEVVISGGTLAIASFYKAEFKLTSVTSGVRNIRDTWAVDLGLGLEFFTTTWRVG